MKIPLIVDFPLETLCLAKIFCFIVIYIKGNVRVRQCFFATQQIACFSFLAFLVI